MENKQVQSIGAHSLSRQVISCELTAFAFIIMMIWLNELIDIPHLLFMAEATPTNWREAIFETVLIFPFGLFIILYTRNLFHRLKYLEGLLPICSSCKKIKDHQGNWHIMEHYISTHSDARFSHSLCPGCAHELYPDIFPADTSQNISKF